MKTCRNKKKYISKPNMFRYRPTLTITKSMDKRVKLQSSKFPESDSIESLMSTYYIDIPTQFKGQEVWSSYISDVRDQGNCGACWAFSSVGMLSDRFSILTMGQLKINMSVSKVVLCDWGGEEEKAYPFFTDKMKKDIKKRYKYDVACNGNSIQSALNYLYRYGTCTEKCVPYDLGDFPDISNGEGESLPVCQTIVGKNFDRCITGQPMRVFRSLTSYNVPRDVKSIQYEILRWGPVLTSFLIYEDFYKYDPIRDGIYIHKGNDLFVTGHAVEIVGWGTGDNDIKYWWIKNTWGSDWGENGYFKCEMMNEMLQLEDNVMACIPDIPTLGSDVIITYVLPRFIIETKQDEKVRERYKVHSSGYPLTIVNQIKNGDIFGVDISPIVITSKLPNFTSKSAFQIVTGDFLGNITNYQDPPIVFSIPEYNIRIKSINKIEKIYRTNRKYKYIDLQTQSKRSINKSRGDFIWLLISISALITIIVYWLIVDYKILKRMNQTNKIVT